MKTTIETKIRFSDRDQESFLRFGSVLDLLQDCMNVQSESVGLGAAHQMETGRAWILSTWYVELGDWFGCDDNLTVTTWPYELKGACARRNAVIASFENPEKIVARADCLWAFYDAEKRKLTRITPEEMNRYSVEERLDMNYPKGKIAKAENYEKKNPFVARKYQLDFNRHMNNSWYVRLGEEFLEDPSAIGSFRVEYKKPAVLGDRLIPFVAKEQDRILVELRNDEDEIYAKIEFTGRCAAGQRRRNGD